MYFIILPLFLYSFSAASMNLNGDNSKGLDPKAIIKELIKQNEDLRIQNEDLKKQNADLRIQNEDLIKENAHLDEALDVAVDKIELLERKLNIPERCYKRPFNQSDNNDSVDKSQALSPKESGESYNLTKRIMIGAAFLAIGFVAVNTVMSKQTATPFPGIKN